jgi:hypothetical protein
MKKLLFVAVILCNGSLLKSGDMADIAHLQKETVQNNQTNQTNSCKLYYTPLAFRLTFIRSFIDALLGFGTFAALGALASERCWGDTSVQDEGTALRGSNSFKLSSVKKIGLFGLGLLAAIRGVMSFIGDSITIDDLQYEIRQLQQEIAAQKNCTLNS